MFVFFIAVYCPLGLFQTSIATLNHRWCTVLLDVTVLAPSQFTMLFSVFSLGLKNTGKQDVYCITSKTDVGIVTYATFLLNVSLVLQDQKQAQFDSQSHWIL